MVTSVAPQEAAALLERGDVEIVDVRTAREWATGHLPNARHLPLDELRADPRAALPNDRVLFVCEKGSRSRTAAGVAERRGLTQVYTLEGGTSAWIKAGLPIDVPGRESPAPSKPPAAPAGPKPEASAQADRSLDELVAGNLRRLRDAKGLSLDALAKKAAVSRAQLGQIELGKGAPSLNILWRLARALAVPFATLVAAPPRTGTTVMRRSKAKEIVSAEGRFSSRALFPPGDEGRVEFYELWLAPHSREEAEAHQPGTRENLVVNSGRLDLVVGSEKYRLVAGDAIAFTADVPHAYVNAGSDECWMCLVMSYASSLG